MPILFYVSIGLGIANPLTDDIAAYSTKTLANPLREPAENSR